MKRLILAAVLLCATPAAAQQTVSPPVVVRPLPSPPVVDQAATARYVADFTRLCLDTGGERAAVHAAAAAAGWVPGEPAPEWRDAVDLSVFTSPDGLGGTLLTSASSPGELEGGLIVRTCILQPHLGSAGPRARLEAAASEAVGLPGKRTAQGLVWLVSGTLVGGFADESANFAAAGDTDAGFALATKRPLLMLTLVGDPLESGLALMRVSPE